ncbi:hypothetical protein RFI_33501, partial [Reticulomyxa filosa]
YIQQTIQISAILKWSHSIYANLIYIALDCCEDDTNTAIELLHEFEKWKCQDNNEQKYKKRANKFLERRCCDHSVNLFSIFLCEGFKGLTAVESATIYTIHNGLPIVENDKKINQNKN